MVRVKRPARSKTSQGVNKVNDPSLCLTGVNSEVEPHGKGDPHASTHNMNHDLEERCSKNCSSTSVDCPNSTEFNNVVEGMKLNSHRSECRRKGSVISIEPSETYYSRRKGFLRLVKPLKTYHRRRSGYVTLRINPLAIQNSMKTKVEDIDLCVVNNMCKEEMTAGESSSMAENMVLESENLSNPVLPKSTCVKFTEENSEKSDMIVASSLIVSDAEHVKRKHCDVEEASLSETMKRQRMIQPGTTDVKNLSEEGASSSSIKRKLLVLDINGLLADIVPLARVSPECVPDPETIVAGKAVFKRPFCDEFLEFCFERFDVGVWSSRTKKNVDSVLDLLMGKVRKNLLFFWDQSHCTCTSYYTPDNGDKPLFFKKLNKLWEKSESSCPWMRGDHDESNTLLLDDSPYKALLNPPNTAIFPHSYQYTNANDNSLGPGGDLRTYLEGLSLAPNVQDYVKQNSYGQDPITEKHESWSFYQKVIESTVARSVRKPYPSLVSSEKFRKDISQGNNASVIAETSKESLNSNGTSGQLKNSIPILMETAKADGNSSGSPSSIQRGYKRDRSKSPRNETSQSHSLSPKKCRRSKSPEPSHGSGFRVDSTRTYQNQTLRPKCFNFSQGKCLRGASCRLVHHQSYPDRRVQEHVGQIRERISVPRECYDFIQGRCKWGASCRFLHSVPRECYDFIQGKCKWGTRCRFLHNVPVKIDVGTEANQTHDKQRDKVVIGTEADETHDKTEANQTDDKQRDKSPHRVCNDFGKEAHGTHSKELYNIRRENAEPRYCNDFNRGKCNWGANCRFLHSVPDKTDQLSSFHSRRYQDANISEDCVEAKKSSFNGDGRYKAIPEICRNYTQGRCYKESHCRYLHQKISETVGSGSTSPPGDTSRYKAVRGVCRNYNEGLCHKGSDCVYLHQEPDRTGLGSTSQRGETIGCRNYTQGRCHKGPDCRFLHREPGMGVGSGSTSQLGETSRFKAVPEVCRKNIQGKCLNGTNCRYLHQELGPNSGSWSAQFCETSKYKSLPEVCRNFIHGRCHKGSDCRYLHQKPAVTVGSGSTSQADETSSGKAPQGVCRNYTLGRCHKGSECQFLHQEQGSSRSSRSPSPPERCYDYTRGKCFRGVHCRYVHLEPDQIASTKFYRTHQQDKDVSSNSKSSGSGGDEKGDALETLPNEPVNKESFQEASTVPDDDTKGENHLENGVHLSVGNLGDSDGIIPDADSSVNEDKRGTMEALPNHPISNDCYEKPSVVIKDGIEDDRVNVVCASMDNLGDSDRMKQDSDNHPEQMSDL